LVEYVQIKVKTIIKRLNDVKRQTNYLVCNIEGTGPSDSLERSFQMNLSLLCMINGVYFSCMFIDFYMSNPAAYYVHIKISTGRVHTCWRDKRGLYNPDTIQKSNPIWSFIIYIFSIKEL